MTISTAGRVDSVHKVELRRSFPTMDFQWFLEIVAMYSNDPKVLAEVLQEEEARAKKVQEQETAKQEEVLARVMSVVHLELNIDVPPGWDKEHVQALVMYGFVQPGSDGAYAGGCKVLGRHVRVNTRNKLVHRFDNRKYDEAVAYLVAQGVLNVFDSGGEGRAYSLNVREKAAKVTPQGRAIIDEAKRCLRSK